MALLIAFAVRLLPVLAIFLLRRGAVTAWVLTLAIGVTLVMVVFNMYADYLRSTYHANEYNPPVADPLRARLKGLVPFQLGTWLAYVIVLILLLVV